MNVNDFTKEVKQLKNLKKFFVDKSGEIYSTEELHEKLARELCQEKKWNWKDYDISAEEFLLKEKGYIKVSNYGKDKHFRYIAINKKFLRNNKVIDNAEWLVYILNLRLEVY